MPIKIDSSSFVTEKVYDMEYVENNVGVYMYAGYRIDLDNIKTVSLGYGIVFNIHNGKILSKITRPNDWHEGFHKLADVVSIKVS